MLQTNHIDPSAVPRPTGAARQDAENMYRFLYNLVGDLAYRLGQAEAEIRALKEQKKKKG